MSRLRKGLNHSLRSLRAAKRTLLPDFSLARYPRVMRAYDRLVTAVRQDVLEDVQGHRMRLDPLDSLKLSLHRIYEPAETAFMTRRVQPGWVVADVGANIGYFTLLLARAVGPRGQVLAFEPDPANAALLRENVTLNGYTHVITREAALGTAPGTLPLYRNPDNLGDHRSYAPAADWEAVNVPVVAFDAVAPERVDFVKVDVQGAEPAVLVGMQQTLTRNPDVLLLIECWPQGLAEAGHDPRALLDLLTGHGFTLRELTDAGDAGAVVDPDALLSRLTPTNGRHTNLVAQRG